MAGFDVVRRTTLDAAEVWQRLTDWEAHSSLIPLTTVRTDGGEGVGATFVARTRLGRWAFDDPMVVVAWTPPGDGAAGYCRVVKTGRWLAGGASLVVRPRDGGSEVHWHEEARPLGLGGPFAWPSDLVGRVLFGRLVDALLAAPPGDRRRPSVNPG